VISGAAELADIDRAATASAIEDTHRDRAGPALGPWLGNVIFEPAWRFSEIPDGDTLRQAQSHCRVRT
jgi:hypothetical protein